MCDSTPFNDLGEKQRMKKVFHFVRRVLIEQIQGNGKKAALAVAEAKINQVIETLPQGFRKQADLISLKHLIRDASWDHEAARKAIEIIDQLASYFGFSVIEEGLKK